jgi:hypothetical protein
VSGAETEQENGDGDEVGTGCVFVQETWDEVGVGIEVCMSIGESPKVFQIPKGQLQFSHPDYGGTDTLLCRTSLQKRPC